MESSSVFYGIVFVFLIGKKVVERQRSAEGGRERQWRGEESCECLEVNVQKSGNGDSEMSVQLQTRVFFRSTLPVKSHILVFGPILSPNLPMKAPARKLNREHNACRSAV